MTLKRTLVIVFLILFVSHLNSTSVFAQCASCEARKQAEAEKAALEAAVHHAEGTVLPEQNTDVVD